MRGVINSREKLVILMVDDCAGKEEESRKIEGQQGKEHTSSMLWVRSACASRQSQEGDSASLSFEPNIGQRASSEGGIHSQPT